MSRKTKPRPTGTNGGSGANKKHAHGAQFTSSGRTDAAARVARHWPEIWRRLAKPGARCENCGAGFAGRPGGLLFLEHEAGGAVLVSACLICPACKKALHRDGETALRRVFENALNGAKLAMSPAGGTA